MESQLDLEGVLKHRLVGQPVAKITELAERYIGLLDADLNEARDSATAGRLVERSAEAYAEFAYHIGNGPDDGPHKQAGLNSLRASFFGFRQRGYNREADLSA